MEKFPAAIPRRMFWSTSVGTAQCPLCKSDLEPEKHSYFMIIWEVEGPAEFITGSDGGFFCTNCPVVVLDSDKFTRLAKAAFRIPVEEFRFTVIGMVDLEAIPEDKRDVPLGEEDNPIPLVEFINIAKSAISPKERAEMRAKKRRQQKKKKRK